VELVGGSQQGRLQGGPALGLGAGGDAVDLLSSEPEHLRETNVLAPLIVGAAVVAGAKDEQLALARGQLAAREQKPAEPQPDLEEAFMAGEGREDVVVPARQVRGRRPEGVEQFSLSVGPLGLGQRRDAGGFRRYGRTTSCTSRLMP